MKILLFYITFPNQATTANIIKLLLEKRLIACANILPITACYEWNGVMQNDGEIAVLFKSIPKLANTVIEEVEKNHPYDVPCIISWVVEANEIYGKWVHVQVKDSHEG
ncbi:MAG: divalent-cation tolerance protein CutA [Saprospiraceae bacterium]